MVQELERLVKALQGVGLESSVLGVGIRLRK